uniref:ARAD1A16280p n=1 Tax=Blastobotrys adeninivorans TaxID=409370 RepID=A0A060SYH0_BLAAD
MPTLDLCYSLNHLPNLLDAGIQRSTDRLLGYRVTCKVPGRQGIVIREELDDVRLAGNELSELIQATVLMVTVSLPTKFLTVYLCTAQVSNVFIFPSASPPPPLTIGTNIDIV